MLYILYFVHFVIKLSLNYRIRACREENIKTKNSKQLSNKFLVLFLLKEKNKNNY